MLIGLFKNFLGFESYTCILIITAMISETRNEIEITEYVNLSLSFLLYTGTMQSTENQVLNFSTSKNSTDTQSYGGLNSVVNGQQETGNKNVNGAQKDLVNGKATFAEQCSINSDYRNSTVRNGASSTRLDDSLQKLRIDESRKNGFEDIV